MNGGHPVLLSLLHLMMRSSSDTKTWRTWPLLFLHGRLRPHDVLRPSARGIRADPVPDPAVYFGAGKRQPTCYHGF